MKKSIIKRIIPLLCCALLLCATMLSACSGDRGLDPKKPLSLELWNYYNGQQKLAFDQLVNEFNETVGQEKGITIESFNQGTVNELTDKVVAAAEKKVGAPEIPDIFAAYADTAYLLDQMGLVAALDPYLTQKELDEYIPGYLEEGRFDAKGNLKIFPIGKTTEIFLLNTTDWEKFAAATGSSLDSLSTIEGVTKTAEQYYNWTASQSPDKKGKAFFGRDAMANYFIIGSRQLGTEILQVENGTVKLNIDENVFRKLWDNFYVPFVKGHFAAEGKFRSDDMKIGSLIALVGSTSGAVYFPDKVNISDTQNYPIEATAIPAPKFEGGANFAVQQGAGMVVTKSTETKEYAATVFLKWFTEAERNLAFSVSSGYLPVKTAANDSEALKQALANSKNGEGSPRLEQALAVGMEMTKTEDLYTNKAFKGGTDSRKILEYSMIDKAKADKKDLLSQIEQGKSPEEAAAAFCTDENYSAWFKEFQAQMQQAVS